MEEELYHLLVIRIGKRTQGFKRVPRMSETLNRTEESEFKAAMRDTIRKASKVEIFHRIQGQNFSAEFYQTLSVQK